MLKTLTINAITQYIDDNLEHISMDIEKLVNYSGYSRRYLQNLFKDNIGMAIGKYIQLRRVTRAAVLLRFTNLSIADISVRLFYDSQQTFTREFKKNSGYTPLQYRKGQLWSFKNMTGHRDVSDNFPIPEICYLGRQKFNGRKLSFWEKIPLTSPLSKSKWKAIDSFLSSKSSAIYISNKLNMNRINRESVYFDAFFWNVKGERNSNEELEEGFYAKFSLDGTKDDYFKLIYNIYMNTLPFYNLQKKDSYDLEIISRFDNDTYHFEYFLPVIIEPQALLAMPSRP